MQPEDMTVGWREWIAMPSLGIDKIKVKVDTGARSSSLHAFDVNIVHRRGKEVVRFKVHPIQRDSEQTVEAEADLLEYRKVTSSTGHATLRPVICTEIVILGQQFPIELTLAQRDEMGFRMLLGREAVRGRFVVDPGRSYLGRRRARRLEKLAREEQQRQAAHRKRKRR